MTTGRAGARLLLAVLAGMVLVAGAGPLAAPALAATRLEVGAGHGGFHVPGRAVPLRVTVSAERLVHGELVVVAPGRQEPITTLDVEVAGGSVKRFLLVVPGGVAADTGSLTVALRQDGQKVGTGKADLRPAADAELVGLAPGLADGRPLPGTAPLAVDAGVARFAAVDAALLATPAALESLSTIGLAAGELATLTPSARTGLLRWVGAGGHLLLDDAAAVPVDRLPADWQPGPTGRAVAGQGEVRLVAGAMAAGRWAGLVEPTTTSRPSGADGWSGDGVANSLAGDAGLRLPRLAILLGFLGVYIVVVGPLTAFVLRRRRRPELAWVAVPVVALLFTGVAWAGGNQLRPGAGLAHATLLDTDPQGATGTSWVGFTRRQPGTATVDLPAGWTLEPAQRNDGTGAALPTSGPAASGAGTTSRLPLASGEFGLLKASGPVAVDGRLEVSASAPAGDQQLRGTVKNGLPFAVSQVAVFAGGARTMVGDLAPGQSQDWTIDTTNRSFDPSGWDIWGQRFSDGGPFDEQDGPVNLSLWQAAATDTLMDERLATGVMAVGWTREWQPQLSVDGLKQAAPGRTAVLGRAVIGSPDGRIAPLAVRREIVRGPFPSFFKGMAMGAGEATVAKFTLPPGVDPAGRRLVLESSMAMNAAEVWKDGRWQPLDGFFQGPNGVVIFGDKRAIIRGGIGFDVGPGPDDIARRLKGFDEVPAIPVPTTLALPAPGGAPGAGPVTTAPVPTPPGVPAPGPRPIAPPPPMAVPGFGPGVMGGVVSELLLPEGSVVGGVVFIRFTLDPSMMSPDATLTLGEAS